MAETLLVRRKTLIKNHSLYLKQIWTHAYVLIYQLALAVVSSNLKLTTLKGLEIKRGSDNGTKKGTLN